MNSISINCSLLLALLGYVFWRLLSIGRRPKGFPPGPPTLPILGNIHQMPAKDAHLQFEAWAREYGDIYSLMLGTKTLIVLSSAESIKELLDRRGHNYSDRQEMYIGQDLCSGGLRMLMMPYGPKWRGIRKMMHGLLNKEVAPSYVPYQMLENRQMLKELLDSPDQFLQHIRRYAYSLTTSMVFGWRTPTFADHKMQQFFDSTEKFLEINQTGTAALIDFFPILRRLPDVLLPMQKKAKELHRAERSLYLDHWFAAKKEIEDGTIKNCFCLGMAKAQKEEGFSDAQAAYNAGTLLDAGSDTTSNTLYAFVQAMLLYPEVQRHAQRDVDLIVGETRLPTLEDQPNLPYIRMIMKETLRWCPTALLGAVPHAATKADIYKGYYIPAGADVMNNVWAINMDSSRSPNPRVFDPLRYKDDVTDLVESASHPDVRVRDQFVFGAGRRICSGISLAENSLLLGISRFLWAFEVAPKVNAEGQKILPDQERLTQGFLCRPEEFEARIVPRSKRKAEIVRKEWESAESELLDPVTQQWIKSPI